MVLDGELTEKMNRYTPTIDELATIMDLEDLEQLLILLMSKCWYLKEKADSSLFADQPQKLKVCWI